MMQLLQARLRARTALCARSSPGGPNAANPHASPSERKLQAGDLLVVDWGAAYDGYISDLTRTFAVGEVDAECRKIHKIVQEANAAGRAASKPGVPCANVDIAARTVIEKSGYGKYFTHRTGHGIGMEGHEDPYMRGDNMQTARSPAWRTPSNRASTCRAATASASKTTWSSPALARMCLSDMPREIRVVG
ncbi:MAG: M24 family metallopeptidase [Candidatus Moduliflexus flocculans]|nr:M24 family metallopeptidase [Candidatus Moduliflexus flocculans]